MDWREITAKTMDEAIAAALLEIGTTIENMEYEVIEKESSGFLGMFSKSAKIRARLKKSPQNITKKFLDDVFRSMGIAATAVVNYDVENATIEINIDGDEMGVLIGKRGQTLDSLQYLVSLVVNKNSENYIKVKLDTENYRARRKETLENLAKNIAFKVKRTRKPVSLEPMNPYERRIIHSALQNDKYVETYSEGEEPYRKVVINIKKGIVDKKYSNDRKFTPDKKYTSNRPAGTTGGYRKDFNRDNVVSAANTISAASTTNTTSTSNGTNTTITPSVVNNTSTPSTTNSTYTPSAANTAYKPSAANSNYASSGATNKNYRKPFNTSKSTYNKNYSADYKKDYELYKESKEKKAADADAAAEAEGK